MNDTNDMHDQNIDDARLTAYVLGELDAAQTAEVEVLLQSSEPARQAVEEIRAITGLLSEGLVAEPQGALTDTQRAAVLAGTASAAAAGGTPVTRMTWVRNFVPLAAAATLILSAVIMLMQDRSEGAVAGPAGGPAPTSPVPTSPVARLDLDMTEAARQAGDTSNGTGNLGALTGRRREGHDLTSKSAKYELSLERWSSAASPGEARDDGEFKRMPSEAMPADQTVALDAQTLTHLKSLGYIGGDNGIDFADEAPPLVDLAEQTDPLLLPSSPSTTPTSEPTVSVNFGLIGRRKNPGKSGGMASKPGENEAAIGILSGRGRGLDAGRQPFPSGGAAGEFSDDHLAAFGVMGRYADHEDARHQRFYTPGQEGYVDVVDNPFKLPIGEDALSTFSIDVDTGSYSNVRRLLGEGTLPAAEVVRIEELINYFDYADEAPKNEELPFAVHVETAPAPWAPEHRLVRIGLKGYEVPQAERPSANLVFLLDVSGSMRSPDKLPLLKSSMRLMVNALEARDRVAIVTYAGSSGLVLDSTTCDRKSDINAALLRLQAGGSTNGGAGIELAYKVAADNFIKGGINRVMLATDGDFNVGVTQRDDLEALITRQAADGVFLSVLGFGTGNLKDSTVEMLADKGNGHYAYIDSLDEGRRVLVDQIGATLQVIAKDVKMQVEFNPGHVGAWRLIGYGNRMLAARDFNDDTKDAGEIGAGHGVTALYEIAPPGTQVIPGVDPLKYQKLADVPAPEFVDSPELMTLKLRWKLLDSDTSTKIELPVIDAETALEEPSTELRFAASVAAFGMLLRDSPYRGAVDWDLISSLALSGRGADPKGYRAEFSRLVDTARAIAGE